MNAKGNAWQAAQARAWKPGIPALAGKTPSLDEAKRCLARAAKREKASRASAPPPSMGWRRMRQAEARRPRLTLPAMLESHGNLSVSANARPPKAYGILLGLKWHIPSKL
jgi:hypothetical protein